MNPLIGHDCNGRSGVHRLYREANLAVRRKKRKKVAQANRLPRRMPSRRT